MGEAPIPSLVAPPAPRKSSNSSSSSLRFLGVLKQPDSIPPNPNPRLSLELDESDVVWSSSVSDDSDFLLPSAAAATENLGPASPISSTSSFSSVDAAVYSPSTPAAARRGQHQSRPFTPEKFGLSAALEAEDPVPLMQQRKPAMDLYLSAARAVPAPKSGSRPDDRSAMPGAGKLFHMSAPVNVPVWPGKDRGRRGGGIGGGGRWGFDELDYEAGFGDEDGKKGEDDEDGGEMVPPHIIVARSHVTTFSVFEGVGRTLKGRDLRRVRNAVLQKTGFLN